MQKVVVKYQRGIVLLLYFDVCVLEGKLWN